MDSSQAEIVYPVQPSPRSEPHWIVVGASVQGTSHIQAGLPCQDYAAYLSLDDTTLAAVIADGLGSEPRSRQGARLAAEACLAFLEAELGWGAPDDPLTWRRLLQEAFSWARRVLEQAAQKEQAALKEFGTTLLMVVLSGEWLASAHIGDGAAVALLEHGSVQTVCGPQNGEYINETFPLTMPGALEQAEYTAQRLPVKALALLTDGMCALSLRRADQAPHVPFFQPLFQQLPTITDPPAASQKLAAFMISERVCAATDDDKTLVLIGKRPG